MRKIVWIAVLLLPLFAFAQRPNTFVRPDSMARDPLHAFYFRYGLNPDSAVTPQLYLSVFDWIGTRYQYAGDCKKGIDCSGFVGEMYSQVYCKTLSGGSKDLFTQVDTVSRNELKEGDILFFKIRKGQISHVAIYLGNHKFAHASVHGGVMISDLREEYYAKYFYRAGRLKK